MPRPTMLPTPISSTEIKGQDSTQQLSTLQMSFELPPSAIGNSEASRPLRPEIKTPITAPNSDTVPSKVAYPVQASETVKSRRRSSAAQKETFALPPPPTRSRKIIQMKPKQDEPAETSEPVKTSPAKGAAATGAKKKQPSATSAAGRKIARKTAHSLIERRRRSKMNEEFAVLKSLIPACTGEMHKLAILQASIDYVRYLEDCVSKLKAQRDPESSAPTPTPFVLPPPESRDAYDVDGQGEYDDDEGDVEMAESQTASPTFTEATSRSQQFSESPILIAQDGRHRQHSYSSASKDPRQYSYSAQSANSPSLVPQGYVYVRGPASGPNSTLTSPALAPQRDLDQEASAALLMLNTDRRGTQGNGPGRGMSVRDLLSA